MDKILIAHKDLTEDTAWVERAAWEANRVLKEAELDAAVVDWGADVKGEIAWLNIECGEYSFDLGISREFMEYRCFSAGEGETGPNMKERFLSFVRRAKPALFCQNGTSRFVYSLDLEAADGVEIQYEGDAPFRNFDDVVKAEAELAAQRLAAWEAAEKARKEKTSGAKTAAAASA